MAAMAAILKMYFLLLLLNQKSIDSKLIGSIGVTCRKIDFQEGCYGSHLGFPIGMILATFDLQVTQMLPSKFGVNWPFGSGEESKN